MIARVNQIDLYYESQGSGDPVVVIPGLGSDANSWALFVAEIAHQYRVIIVENRGSVRSAKPEGPYTTEQMAEDAVALMEHLDIPRAHVLGKSLGGMIAQVIAARYPERVRSVVLASTLMRHDGYGEELLELGRTLAEKAGLFATFRQAFLLSYSREYCATNRSRLAEVEALMAHMDPKEALRGYLAQSLACQHHNSQALAPKIKAPAMVIVGQDDLITPPQASRELAAAIPGSELVVFPRGGHGFWREFPVEVNGLVRDFLIRH